MNIHKTLRLMIPGPVSVDPAVLAAVGGPVQPHYGPAFRELFFETLDLLKSVFGTRNDVYLMAGSGTVAVDACIGSALRGGDTIVIGRNGFFGERLNEIAQRYGLNVVVVDAEWGQPLRVADLLAALDAHPEARAVAVVHLETSTTILNPVAEIGQALAGREALFIVDAVSSLGGVPFDVDEWGIDLCASATQKCLGSLPGLAPLTVSPRAWQVIDRAPLAGHGWYSDLRTWRKYQVEWGDWHPSPVTMSSNLVAALNVSLCQLKAEGIETRLARYQCLALRLRDGLAQLGLQVYTPEPLMNPVLTAAYMPAGIPSGKLIQYLENECCIKISPGLGALKEKIFRVGHMSPVVGDQDIDDVLQGIADFLKTQ